MEGDKYCVSAVRWEETGIKRQTQRRSRETEKADRTGREQNSKETDRESKRKETQTKRDLKLKETETVTLKETEL